MAELSKRRFQAFAQVWPDGPTQLISELKELGFAVRELSPADEQMLKGRWSQLLVPRSAEVASADGASYAYLNKLPKGFRSESWGLLLVAPALEAQIAVLNSKVPVLWTNLPDAAFDYILTKVAEPLWSGPGVQIPAHVSAEPGVVVGPGCEFAEGVVLEAGVRLGACVKIGKNTRVGAYSVIYDHCEVGHSCEIKAHAVIGGLGFGFLQYPQIPRAVQRRHVGRVLIGDYVRIGSMVAVDRGVIEDTVIGAASALDNFVQVAHNCELGEHNVLCGFVGLSGSTKMGRQVTMGGMSGSGGHLRIGDQVTIAGQTGVSSDVASNSVVKGYPPRPLKETLRIEVLTGKLPEFYERLKALEKKVK